MKTFLIIPMGGKGQRFIDAGYKIYKPFLKTSNKERIIDGIIKNFDKKENEIIIIGNRKRIEKKNINLKRKFHFININNHKYGPLYSIFLAAKKIESIVKENRCFICYSDINWKWNWAKVKHFIKNKKVVIFSHTGFHPHLEINRSSDFFLLKKNKIKDIREKKLFNKDYKNNFLATGCYYFRNFQLLKKFMPPFKNKRNLKKEYYLVTLIKNIIKNKIKINHFNIKNFVHLGLPTQYEDYKNWRNLIVEDINKSINLNFQNVMLMAGQGERIKKLSQKKPFLKINKINIYEFIFKKFGTKKNFILTNKNYTRGLGKRDNIYDIGNSDSMLQTIEKSKQFIKDKKKYFLSSCDCYGNFKKNEFRNFLSSKNPDVVLFAYNFSELQKKLVNAHTTIDFKGGRLKSISVKNNSTNNIFGHAGFFWIKDYKVFNYINEFKKSFKFKNREMLVDHYFKYLFDYNKLNVECYKLSNYVHIGSVSEYYEFKYWEDYFK